MKKKTKRLVAIAIAAILVLGAIGPVIATFKTATSTPTTESTAEEKDSANYMLPNKDPKDLEDLQLPDHDQADERIEEVGNYSSADYMLPEKDIDEPEDCDLSSYTTVDLPNGAEIQMRIMCP